MLTAFSLSTGLYVAPDMAALKNASNASNALALIAPMRQKGAVSLFDQMVRMETTVNSAVTAMNLILDGVGTLSVSYDVGVRDASPPT